MFDRRPSRLPDELSIYRAIARKEWVDPETKRIDRRAFVLRPKIQEKALSFATSPEIASKFLKKEIYGFIEMKVGDIRGLGLKVVEDRSRHVSVSGFPDAESMVESDQQLARDLAGKLAKKAKFVS